MSPVKNCKSRGSFRYELPSSAAGQRGDVAAAAPVEVTSCRVMNGMLVPPTAKRQPDHSPTPTPTRLFARRECRNDPCAQSEGQHPTPARHPPASPTESGQLRWPGAARDGNEDTNVSDRLDDRYGGRDSRVPAREQARQPPFDGMGNQRLPCPWSGSTRLRCARQTSQTIRPALLNNGRLTARPPEDLSVYAVSQASWRARARAQH